MFTSPVRSTAAFRRTIPSQVAVIVRPSNQAAQLIHRKVEVQQSNPLLQLIAKVKGAIGLQ